MYSVLENAIGESRQMLNLEKDWDGNEAVPIDVETWNVAVGLVRRTATSIYIRSGAMLPIPSIDPCSNGSIDLHWKTEKINLLVNIHPGRNGDSEYYGETSEGVTKKRNTVCSC
jgi:hypothetical protein